MASKKQAKAKRTAKPRKVIPMPAVEVRTMADEPGPPLGDSCVRLPKPPDTGKAYLIVDNGVYSWEPA